ncbi:sigma 54-interacting transcriptional regulator [Marinisporobacter balticus]|uniref:Arginine utilization regulatory protein n=1 Tax=Marinisporobacter balticus TaxID=2018667 RepID=A0A4R2KFU2_9FIRM|nr:sigma 54-interacting transcriptional regulator [Marinisporobacter balticus]TCO69249.1 arginine utilization regulatory protein [Marinisporobacter balticus]
MHMSELYNCELFEEILNHSNDGFNVVDPNGLVIYANRMSAQYANTTARDMIGKPITDFYEEAVLLRVLKTQKPVLDEKIHYVNNKKYIVNSYPIIRDGEFIGAYSVFKDIRDIEELNKRVSYLEVHLEINKPEKDILDIIGKQGSLNSIITQAKRTVGSLGGPRHSIISGESGTGKTMLAKLIYNYAKQVGVIDKKAPFIEVNCAQFTNPDIAAVEIFGSEAGAYTGSRQKKGLFEQAHGGILFLDEAHALEQYQNLLLKAIESGTTRRIGGTYEIPADVIIIAASTRDLKTHLLPELYQRLAQYAIHIPSLDERDLDEKKLLFDHFVNKYRLAVEKIHTITYQLCFSDEAKDILIKAKYPRNIRQFRDVINFSIDSAAPLISDIGKTNKITTLVETKHLPFELFEEVNSVEMPKPKYRIDEEVQAKIISLNLEGLGPRKISAKLKEEDIFIAYYQIAYFLKKKTTAKTFDHR